MTISPFPVPEDRPSRTRYDWSRIVIGEWQCWLDVRGEDITDNEALKQATRIRLAARDYAARHGLTVQSRRTQHGRTLDLRFTPES